MERESEIEKRRREREERETVTRMLKGGEGRKKRKNAVDRMIAQTGLGE